MGALPCGGSIQTKDEERLHEEAKNANTARQLQKGKSKEFEKKIVLIGAGPAGIHMASKLIKAGYSNIVILEKTSRSCGKSMTVRDPDGKATYDGYQPVHELGTCYLSPEYHAVHALLQEYDPKNEELGVPSRSVFGTQLNEEIQHRDEADQKAVDFTDWALNQSELLAVPKRFHWINDNITGGLAFGEAILKYGKVHRKIFGNPPTHQAYPFLNKPSDEDLPRLNCTFLEFLKDNKCEALVPFMVYSQSVQGYGTLDKIPAYYGLMWNTPALMETISNIFRLASDQTNVIVLKKGFQHLWSKMVQKHNLQIEYNCEITSVNRFLDDSKKKTKIWYKQRDKTQIQKPMRMPTKKVNDDDEKVPMMASDASSLNYNEKGGDEKDEIDGKTQEIECDYLFLACGCKKALKFLTDATDEETEVFGCIRPHTLCTTLYECDVDVDYKTQTVVSLWPNVIWAANGHLYAHRNSLKCLLEHEKYHDLVGKKQIVKDRCVSYQFLERPPDKFKDAPILLDILKKDLETWGEKGVKILRQECWDYLPIWENDAIQKGYPWKVKNDMQGKNKGTYYIGSSVCFESVENVVEYNDTIFDEQFAFLKNSNDNSNK